MWAMTHDMWHMTWDMYIDKYIPRATFLYDILKNLTKFSFLETKSLFSCAAGPLGVNNQLATSHTVEQLLVINSHA